MKLSILSSPITVAANNIIAINGRSQGSLQRATNEYSSFASFLENKTKELKKVELPNENEIRRLSNINLVNTFGNPSGLVDSLLDESIDYKTLTGRKNSKTKGKVNYNKRRIRPSGRTGKFKIGGFKSLGVLNALFAGLDFATGLQEGETVGKAASGAAGSLVGSVLGGVVGQALIPVPGLGFIVGSTVGGFLGGFTGDRVYEGVSEVKRKQEEKLKEKPQEIKRDYAETNERLNSLIPRFRIPVNKFQSFVKDIIDGKIILNRSMQYEGLPERKDDPNVDPYTGEVSGETFFPLPGGDVGTLGRVSSTQAFGAPRDGGTRPHLGLDMTHHTGALDAAVVAYKTGVVKEAISDGYKGAVGIDHGGGDYTRYVHVTPMVQVGQIVYGGQQIAKLYPAGGDTHLHFEMYKNNTQAVDPLPILGKVKNRLPAPLSVERAKQLHEASAKPQAGPNVFNLELHHPGANETQRSGLIENLLTSGNQVTQDFSAEFGSYPRDFRGGLGGPKKGLNLLEMANELGVENNAQRIIKIIKAHPNYQFNLFAGHTDNKATETGQTGAPGEKEFVIKVANRVMELARASGLRNVTYYKNEADIWEKSKRLWEGAQSNRLQSSILPNLNSPQNRTLIVSVPAAPIIIEGSNGNKYQTLPPKASSSDSSMFASSLEETNRKAERYLSDFYLARLA